MLVDLTYQEILSMKDALESRKNEVFKTLEYLNQRKTVLSNTEIIETLIEIENEKLGRINSLIAKLDFLRG